MTAMPSTTRTARSTTPRKTRIAFQGAPGAFSQLAAYALYPDATSLPMADFAAVVRAVARGRAEFGILPVSNSVMGDVTEARNALHAQEGLEVIAETRFPIRHCLLALPGASRSMIRSVESHPAAIAQCRRYLMAHGLTAVSAADTAGAARDIAMDRNFTRAAIAGRGAAELYGLIVLDSDIADSLDNHTHFVVFASAAAEDAS